MQISTWLWSWLEARQHRHVPQSPLEHAARLTLRKLEERQVLNVAAVFNVTTGALTVTADATDNVTVTVDSTTHDVQVKDGNGDLVAIQDSSSMSPVTVQASDVHDLHVTAMGDFDNTINLSGLTSADFGAGGLSVTVDSGGGNDQIYTGYADQLLIDGGSGNDIIHVDTALSLSVGSSMLTAETIDIGAVSVNVANGASLTFDGLVNLSSSTLSGEFYFNGNAHLDSSSISGDIHLGGDIFADAGTNTINGQIDLDGATHTFTVHDPATLDINADIGDSVGGAGIKKDGDGVLTLAGTNNTYTGTTEIVAGILALSDATSHNNIASSSQILIDSAGFIDVSGLDSSTFALGSGQTFKTLSVYVDDNWAGSTNGINVANVDGHGHSGIFGLTAFGSIQSAVDEVADGGFVEINNGTYNEAVLIDKSLTLDGLSTASDVIISGGLAADGISITSGATNVTVSDLTVENSLDGIHAVSVSGLVTISNVITTGNSSNGIELQNIGSVDIVGVDAESNGGDGINITTVLGTVSLDTVTASNNSGNGVTINEIYGAVTLNDVTADGNNNNGIYLVNILSPATVTVTGGGASSNGQNGLNAFLIDDLTITGGTYSSNNNDGLNFSSITTLHVNSVTADSNLGNGLDTEGTGSVNIKDGSFSSNAANGIFVFTAGDVTLTDVNASDNQAGGAWVSDNNINSVTVTGGTYNGNLATHGLTLFATTVSVDGATANHNAAYGIVIGDATTVNVDNTEASSNGFGGVIVSSSGDVEFTDLTANSNLGLGVNVSAANSVQFTNGTITNNAGAGIEIDGVATTLKLNSTTVTGNSGDGLLVLPNPNTPVPLPGADTVVITGGTYKGNGGDGIHIDSVTTSVEIDSADIESNANYGFEVSNTAELTLSNLTLLANTTGGGNIDTVATVTFNTTNNADTVDVNTSTPSTFQQAGQDAISYSSVATLNVNTLGGNDIVNVTPDANTTIYLDGGTGTDTVTIVSTSSTIAASGSGFVVTTASQPIYGQNFENVDFSGAVIFSGAASDDTLTVTASDSDNATYTFKVGATLVASGTLSNVTSLEFDGLAGDDLFVVNNFVGGVFAPTGGIVFAGGTGGETLGDSLQIIGGTATTVEHQVNGTNGSVVYDATSAITYTGVSSVLDTITVSTMTFTFSGVDETITIQDSGTSGQTQVGTTSQQITFANPSTLLTIDAGDGADIVNFDGVGSGFAASLAIHGGAGDDVVNLNADVLFASSTTLSVDAETINVNDGANLNVDGGSANGSISLTASEALTLNGSATLTAADVSLVTDSLAIASTATVIATTTEIHQFTNGVAINLGSSLDPSGGPLSLSDAELHRIFADTLTIGDSQSGSVTVSNNVTVANVSTLQLITGASVIDVGSAVLTVANLAIEAVTGIGDGQALGLEVGTLAFQNSFSGNVAIHNTGSLTIGAVGLLDGSSGNKVGNFGGGTLQLSAASPITIAIDTTSVGSATITAGESLGLGDNLTIDAGYTVSVTGAGSNLTLQAGDDILVNGNASSTSGNVVLAAGFNDADSSGAIAIAGHITAANLISMSAVTGITDSAGAKLAAQELELTGSGNVVLTVDNEIGTIAAELSGSLTYESVNTFTVGTAGTTTGITLQSGGNLDLTASSGSIELNADIKTGGTQTYHDAVELTSNVILTSTDAGDITFNDTINGAYSLQVNTAGATNIGNDVGANNALTSLTTDSAGTTVIAASQISAGIVTFHDAVQIKSNVGITAGAITFGGTLDESAVGGSTSNVTLTINTAGGDILFTGAVGNTIALDSLTITTADDVTFTSTVATVGNLEQDAGTGTTTFHGTGAGGIGGQLLVTTDNIHLASASVTTTGAVALNAAQAITVDAGLNAGASTIAIHANTANSGAAGFDQTAGVIQTTNNTASAVTITVGGSGDAKLNDVRAATTTGTVTVSATGGAIVDNSASNANLITSGYAALTAAKGIGSGDALETAISHLAFHNTTSGNVSITNTGGLTIDDVGIVHTSSNDATIGTVTLVADSPITFAVNTTSGSTILATATDDSANDHITVNAGVTVESTGGDVIFQAGDNIAIAATAVVKADVGSVTLISGYLDSGDGGSQQLDGLIQAGNTVTINLSNVAGSAAEASTGSIIAPKLQLLSTTNGGSFVLTSATNNVSTLAASVDGAIKYQDVDGVNIGTVSTIGIVTTGDDVTIQSGGAVGINNSISVGAGTVRIAAGGDVTEGAGATVSAAALGVTTSLGNIVLDQSNTVGTFAAADGALNGTVTLVNSTNLTIGSVAQDGTLFAQADGITTNAGDVTISASGFVKLSDSISAAGAIVRITAAGNVTEDTGATISAASLGVRTTSGDIVLTEANDVATFAAKNTNLSGVIKFRDTNSFNVGSVLGTSLFTATTGIGSNNGDVTLKAGTTLGINESINAGTATVRLAAGGSIAEASGKIITADKLGVTTSAGDITLTELNQIHTFAANDSGANGTVKTVTAGGVDINTVAADSNASLFAGVSGVSTANGDFTLNAAGAILISQAISAGAGTVRLQTSTGGVSQTSAGTITATKLGVQNATSGNVILDKNNNVSTIAIKNTVAAATVTYNDISGVTVGSVAADGALFTATDGISTNAGNVTLTTGGLLTIGDGSGQDITAAGATVTLSTSAGGISESAGSIVSATNLLLLGTGNDSLTEANTVGTLAANVTGSIDFVNAGTLSIGSVAGNDGIQTSNDSVSVKTTTGDLDLNQVISAGTGTVTLEATAGSIVDQNDGNTMITAGDLSLTAKTNIGDITSWSAGTGNAIDATITGSLTKAAITDAGGEVFVKFTGNATIGVGALNLGSGVAASAIITATGNLDAGNINSATALSAGDQLALEAGGTLTLPDSGLDVGDTGNLRLHGTNDVVDTSGRDLGPLRASNLDFASGSAGGDTVLNTRIATITAAVSGASASGKALTINEYDGLTLTGVSTTNGNITVNASQSVAGDITVIDVNAGTARATLNTTANGGGQIIDGDLVDSATTADITANEVDLRAATGIGNGNKLEVAANSLAATTVGGDISIRDVSGNLSIANLAAGTNGVSITGGVAGNKIEISTVGSLSVDAIVMNAGTGNRSIVLAADGTTATNDLSINANVTTTGGNSSITLLGGDTVSFAGTSTVYAAGAGAVDVLAGTAFNNGAGQSAGTTTGNIAMADGSVIKSDDGTITLSAPNDVAVSIVNANANNDATLGNIVITANADNSGSGAISETLTGEAANLIGGSATLHAATGIGAADDIDTNLHDISLVNTTSGAVAVQEVAAGGDLILTGTSNVGAAINVSTIDGQLTVSGAVTTTSSGTIDLFAGDSAANGGGNLVLQNTISTGAGQVTLTSEHNDVTFTAAADVTTTSGTIQVKAGTATGGQILMTDDNTNVTVLDAGSGLIDLQAGGDVTLGKLVTTSSSTVAVQIHSTAGAIIDADTNNAVDVDAANGRLVIVAANGIGSANAIETTVASIDVTNTTAGNIKLVDTDALSIQKVLQQASGTVDITSNGAMTIASGGAGVSATSGKVTLSAVGIASTVDVNATISTTSGDVEVDAGSTLTVNQAISTGVGSGGVVNVSNATLNAALSPGAGNITLNGGGQDLIVNVDQTSATTITYSATRDIIIRATVTATGGTSDIKLTADSNGDHVGGVWIDESAVTDAKLDAGHDVILKGSNVSATGSSVDSIRIDNDGSSNQIVAGHDISLIANAAAPVNADIVMEGVMTATTGSISVDSAHQILISADQNAGTSILFQDAVQLTGDITLTAGQDVTFQHELDGAHSLQVNANGTTTFDGAVGVGTALTSLTTNAAGTTDLNGGIVNATTVDLKDAVILTADTTVTGTTVTFEKTVNADATVSNRTLLVNATTTTFGGAIGNSGVLASLATDAAGTTYLNGATIQSTLVDFQDAVVLGTTVTITGTTVSFDSTVDGTAPGAQGLTVNASGSTTFGDGIGDDKVGDLVALSFLTTDAVGTTVLKTTSVTTSGDQTYHDAVKLASNDVSANTTLIGVNVSFDSTVDGTAVGTQGLTVNASGTTTFGDGIGDDKVGGLFSLSFLTTDTAGTTVLKTTSVTTSGDQTYRDAVKLASNTVTTDTTLNGVNVSFDSTVDGTALGAQGLTVNASGTTTFGDGIGDDKVGGLFSLSFLTTDTAGTTILKTSSITTSGDQTYHDVVKLASNSVTANTTLIGVNVSFDQTVDGTAIGTQGLTVNASGTTTFGDGAGDDKVGGMVSLSFLTTDLVGTTVLKTTSVTTSGDQTYHDAVKLASNSVTADTTLTGVNISFDSTVDGTATGTQGLTVNASGTTTFGDGAGDDKVGGLFSLSFLTTDAAGTTVLKTTSVTTSGDQTYHDKVTLASNSVTSVTSLNAHNVTLDDTLNGTASGAQGLRVDATGNVLFTGIVGGSVRLGDVVILNAVNVTESNGFNSTSLVQQAGTGTTTFNGAVTTTNSTGVQLTTNAITVNAPITTTGNGIVTFTNAGLLTINGDVTADGAITQNGAGAVTITEPRSLTTTGDTVNFLRSVTLSGSAGLLTIDTTVGGNTAGAAVTFSSTVHGATSGVNAESLTIDAGTGGAINFVGAVDSLKNVTITNSGNTTFQSSLQADTVLITDTTGTVAFQGNTTLATLTTTNQPYNVTFGKAGGPVVTDSITNAVTFLNTGLVTIGLNAGDSVTFGNGVTHTVSATSITGTLTSIGGAVNLGTTSLNGTIRTQGQQVTVQATTLTGTSVVNTTFGSATGGDITFGSTLNATTAGVEDLTVNAGTAGNILFTGAVGGSVRLGDLAITNAHNVTEQAGITATTLTQTAGTGTTTLNGAVNTNAAGGVVLTTNAITVNAPITTTGAGVVTFTNAGLLTLNADINSDGAVTQNGAGSVLITPPVGGTRSITTTGDSVSFLRAVTLNSQGSTFSINTTGAGNTAGGNVTFSSTLDATSAAPNAEKLLVNAGTGGDVLFTGAVGGIARLGDVTIANAHNVTETGGIRSASLTQTTGTGLTTLNGAVDTNTTTGVNLTTGAVTVNNTVTATDQIVMKALNLNGNINLNSTLQTTQPTGSVSLTAVQGGITNGAAANVANVISNSLVMQTTQGIGSTGNTLLTNVATIAAHNTGSGNIRVDNVSGQLLTISAVGGVNGITNDGAQLGNIAITNNGSILVSSFSSPTNAPMTNSTGGSISLITKGGAFDITVNSPITASGGNGNITLNAGHNVVVNDTGVTNDISASGSGTVYLTAANNLVLGSQNPNTTPDSTQHTVANDVVIQSGTGSVTNTLPLVYNVQAPQLGADGIVTISGDFGRPGEHNFTVTIYWGDGTSTTQTFADAGHFSFSHTYHGNPNHEDQSAPILINVQVAHDPHIVLTAPNVNTSTESVPDTGVPSPPPVPVPNINADLSSAIYNPGDPNYAALHTPDTKIVTATGNVTNPGTVVYQDIRVLATAVPVPGEGLASFPFDVTPAVRYLNFPEQLPAIDVHEVSTLQLNQQDSLRLDLSSADEGIATERQVFLEIIRADGSIEKIRLPETVLDDLMKTIADLPDGRYRFQLIEPGESRLRLLLDTFEVRQGKIVDENDGGDRPPSSSTRPGKQIPVMDDAPADAEEAIQNAHAAVETSWIAPESIVEDASTWSGKRGREVEAAGSLWNGWSSMSARRAWRQAELVTHEMIAQSQDRESAMVFDDQELTVADENGQANLGAVAVVGATMVGLNSAAAKRVVKEAPAQLGRAARLFRKYSKKPK